MFAAMVHESPQIRKNVTGAGRTCRESKLYEKQPTERQEQIGPARLSTGARSGELRNDFASDVGQTVHAAIMEIGELSVIQPELVKNRGVKIIDGVRLDRRTIA